MDLTQRALYGFATDENLRFADQDANGHVNNGAFTQLMETARVRYIGEIVRRPELPRVRMVVGRLEVDFRRQMFYPGRATACARVVEVFEKRMVIGQALFDAAGNCTATLRATMVCLDEATHRSTAFPPEVRHALDRLATSPDGLYPP
ncbi:MAG: acyl-CoA thioesterase [Alphaproteobacteria bacterium]|nr:acyl-CoA thioesterase [Alphaproteobacteria bacterium]